MKKSHELWPEHNPQTDRIAIIAIIIALVLIVATMVVVLLQQIIYLRKVISDIEADTYAAEITTTPTHAAAKTGRILKELPVKVTPTAAITKTGEELPDPAVADGSFKTMLRIGKINRKDSAQYQFKKLCYTDDQGCIRYFQYYSIALGMAYTNTIGETFEVELSTGRIVDCIIGDVKDPRDTDPTMRYIEHNGNIVEFIIDETVMDPNIQAGGDISPLGFEGSIVRISRTDFEEWG